MPIINDILVTFVFCLQFEHRIPGCTIEFVCFVFKLCKDCNYISRLQTILCKDCNYISRLQTILNLLLPLSGLLPCLSTEAINSPTGYQIKETFIIVFLGGTWGDVGGMGHASHLQTKYFC